MPLQTSIPTFVTHCQTLSGLITIQNVRNALDDLLIRYGEDASSPLSQTLLVQYFQSDLDLPYDARNTSYVVQCILIEAISDEFARRRGLSGRSLPEYETTAEVVLRQLIADGASGSRDLIGWSWLYHHYVRPDLGISLEQFKQCIPSAARTLRRYRELALRQLTHLLLDQERVLLRIHRLNRVKARLKPLPHPFVGREQEIQQVERFLNKNQPHHFLVYGVAGIGKTAFVRHLLWGLITTDRIQHIVWINQPMSLAMMQQEIWRQLLSINPGIMKFTVCELTARYRVAIVIDGLDQLLDGNDQNLSGSDSG